MLGIYVRSEAHGALRQGEIITGLIQTKLAPDSVETDRPEMENVVHPFAIVLSQDCDLDQDWKVRVLPQADRNEMQRLLPAVLFAPLNTAESLRGRVDINSGIWARIRQNKDERYHFLTAVPSPDDKLGNGLDELGMDFKRYFTIPTDEVYKRLEGAAQRRCRLVSPYLEHLSTRFCYYQFRVALPSDHQSV